MGMMRKPDGSSGESSLNDASMGAKMSSEHVPAVFSSTPLYICQSSRQHIFTEKRKCHGVQFNRRNHVLRLRLSCSRSD